MVGYEGLYEVGDYGTVCSVERRIPCGRYPGGTRLLPAIVMVPEVSDQGYLRIGLTRDGKQRKHSVHVLVAAAHIGPRPADLQVCHDDDVKFNNWVGNLRYDTGSANIRDAVRNGNQHQSAKVKCAQGHDYDEENTRWVTTKTGRGRQCRRCHRDRERARRQRLTMHDNV